VTDVESHLTNIKYHIMYKEMNLEELKKEYAIMQERASVVETSIDNLSKELGIEPTEEAIQAKLKALKTTIDKNQSKMDSIMDELEALVEPQIVKPQVFENEVNDVIADEEEVEDEDFNED